MSRVGNEPGTKPGEKSTNAFQIDPSKQLGIDHESYSGEGKRDITEIEGIPCAGLMVDCKPRKKVSKRTVKKAKRK